MLSTIASFHLSPDDADSDDADEGSPFPQFDVRIYIILAVVPILIFLIRILWAYVFRRRRQQRRSAGRGRRRRGRHDRDTIDDDDNSSIASSLANPPPSYKELFGETGPNRSSVFAISGRNIPICEQCKETSCSVVSALRHHHENSPQAATAEVSRSTSNSTTLTSVVSHSSSISSNLDDPADLPPSSSSTHSHSRACSGDVVDSSNTTQNISSVRVDVDIERHDTTEPNATQSINASPSVPDSSRSDYVPSTSYVDIEDEASNRSDSGNENNNDNETDHATARGFSHNVQLTQQQQRLQPILTPLSSRNAPSPPRSSHNNISDPCACTCHRTVPYKGRELTGFDNPGYHHESSSHSPDPLDPTRMPHAGMHRVWSNLSTGSTVTLSELPSYQDALELIKKKEAEAMQTSN